MADRPASAVSIRTDTVTTPVLVIRVIRFELDYELQFTRSITSDNQPVTGSLVPCSVFVSAGGIIRGTCYVDPADTTQMVVFALPGIPTIGADFKQKETQIVLDLRDTAGSRYGYKFGTFLGDALFFPMSITGETNEGGMQECLFEIHSQAGITWSNTI